jgi:hypothetical protein
MGILGTTTVPAKIAPSSELDVYPTHDAKYGVGGYRAVPTISDRNSITPERRSHGMKVFVTSTSSEYVLGPGLLNSDWQFVKSYPVVYPTWASLAAVNGANLADSTEIFVQGRVAVGDAGAGAYWYSSSSTVSAISGLVIIPADGVGRFLRRYGNEIRPHFDMGADNTGTTDSGAILQAALNFAADPTYGWAKDAGSAGGLGLAVELHGTFITSVPLVLKGAVDFRGAKVGGRANDFNQYACIHSKHGGHCIVYDLNNDTPHFKLASIRNLFLVGYVETYIQGKKSITSVTSRTVFAVADADAPVGLASSLYAAYNVCVFFDNEGTCLGTGRVASMSSSGGFTTITLESGTDTYSSVNGSAGGLLTTTCKVVFTPKVTEESLNGVADFYDPSAIGCTGIYCKNTHPSLSANVPYIENVYMRQFLVGLRVGPRCFGGSPGISGLGIMFCKVAAVCIPVCISTTDFFFNDQIYTHGGRRYDYGRVGMVNTLDQPALAYGTYGFLGIPIASKFDKLLAEEHAMACVYVSRNIFLEIDHLLCDGICGTGLLIGPGYSAHVAPASSTHHSNSMWIGAFYARHKLDDGTSWDTIHTTTTPVAIRFESTTVSLNLPVYVYLGSAAIITTQNFGGSPPKFPYAFDLGTRSGNPNRVRIGMLQERNGFILMHKAGSKEVEFDDKSAVSAAEVYTGWYWDVAASKRVYCDATQNILELSSTGALLGNSSMVGVPLKTVNSSGDCIVLQKTGGSPQTIGFRVATNQLLFSDLDLNLYFMSMFANASVAQLWIGSNSGNPGPARSSNLYSENRVGGVDLAPSNFNLIAPGGTGAAIANGAFSFYTANPGVSGSTPQGISLKLQILREGQIRFTHIAPTVLGEGDFWFDSTKGLRQYFNAGNRPVGFKRVGSVALVAGVATVSLGTLITPNTLIFLTSQADGGTPGFVRVSSRVDSVSFTITSSSNTDTSTVGWALVEP